MDGKRFDSLARVFARQGNRRNLIAGGLGLAGALVANRTVAQEATPAATPGFDEVTDETEFLFVQPFESGTWLPKAGEDGIYTLSLSGTDAFTIYFSDRPERITGLVPTQQFLDGLGFTPANPPNASIVVMREDGLGPDGSDHEVLMIELFNPVFDAEAKTLTYDAMVLADYGEPGLASLAQQQQDYELGENFGEGSLFIDDCPNGIANCVDSSANVLYPAISIRCCWHASKVICLPCHGAESSYYADKCAEHHKKCENDYCTVTNRLCDPF